MVDQVAQYPSADPATATVRTHSQGDDMSLIKYLPKATISNNPVGGKSHKKMGDMQGQLPLENRPRPGCGERKPFYGKDRVKMLRRKGNKRKIH